MSRTSLPGDISNRLASADPGGIVTDTELARSRARTLAFLALDTQHVPQALHAGGYGDEQYAPVDGGANMVPLPAQPRRIVRRTDGGESASASRRKLSTHNSARPMIRRTVLMAAAAAVLAGGLVATDAVNVFWRAPASAEAVEALNAAAQQTITTSDQILLPGQFLKIDTRAVYADEGEGGAGRLYWLESQDRQLYVPADRGGNWVMNFEAVHPVAYFGKATEAAVKEIAARTPKGRTERGDLRRVDAPWSDEELGALPREPGKLLGEIHDQAGSDGSTADDRALVWISDRLRAGTIPAELRASLYRAAALIPGVTLVDRQATLDGRTGIAIGRVDRSDNTRREIIVDPGNGQFIGERVVDLDGYGAIPPGTATAWTSVKTSVVGTAPTPAP